jgi:dolichyl-phosphate-mannose-protein mannosyltransferase
MSRLRFRPELLALIVAAAITRLWGLFRPDAVVFDEVYFKGFAGHYLDGHYFFDIHPPLGKLLFAGWAHICGLTGVQLATTSALPLRIVPAVFGICIIPLVWGIIRSLGGSRRVAFLGSFLILLDNALIVESRFILTDTILLSTGLAGIYVYLLSRKCAGWKYHFGLISCGLLTGASLSTKWTGLTSLALVIGMLIYDARHHLGKLRWMIDSAKILIPAAFLYISLFYIHFQLLPSSGDGDAFMSQHFQSTLIGNTSYNPSAHVSFPDKFIQLNTEMYQANKTLTATHPYGSHWYSWPLETRPIYYWQGASASDQRQGNIYLLGNPAIWWGALVAVMSGIILYIFRIRSHTKRSQKVIFFLVAAYLMNYLPFATVTRVMFLYHYFFSLIFEIILAVMLWFYILPTISIKPLSSKATWGLYAVILSIVSITFIYFAPLTYGSPLSPSELQQRMWLKSWR